MTERIKAYKAYIDSIINTASPDTNWDEIISQHLIQIKFFMHERLIHLIVTVLFAVMAFMVLGFILTDATIPLLLLFVLILVLLIPYIQHYYLLENSVQYMYKQYDKMLELKGQKAFKL